MSRKESIFRQRYIIDRLRGNSATFDEIKTHLENRLPSDIQHLNFSRRTFSRDINDIDSLYGIEIKCSKATEESPSCYYIKNEYREENAERLIEAFYEIDALNLSQELSNYMYFENRSSGQNEHLYTILKAIKNRKFIKFDYQEFWEEEPNSIYAAPYALREFKRRWYVFVNIEEDDYIERFALDRLSNLHVTKKKFELPEDFDIKKHYEHCFGIMRPEDNPEPDDDPKPEKIVLSFNPEQGKYIKTLPLHKSQKILIDNEQELRIELEIFITYDFFMEILSHGEDVRVLEPDSLKNKLKTTYENLLKLYE